MRHSSRLGLVIFGAIVLTVVSTPRVALGQNVLKDYVFSQEGQEYFAPQDYDARGWLYRTRAGFSGLFRHCDDDAAKRCSPYIYWKCRPQTHGLLQSERLLPSIAAQIDEGIQRVADGAGCCTTPAGCDGAYARLVPTIIAGFSPARHCRTCDQEQCTCSDSIGVSDDWLHVEQTYPAMGGGDAIYYEAPAIDSLGQANDPFAVKSEVAAPGISYRAIEIEQQLFAEQPTSSGNGAETIPFQANVEGSQRQYDGSANVLTNATGPSSVGTGRVSRGTEQGIRRIWDSRKRRFIYVEGGMPVTVAAEHSAPLGAIPLEPITNSQTEIPFESISNLPESAAPVTRSVFERTADAERVPQRLQQHADSTRLAVEQTHAETGNAPTSRRRESNTGGVPLSAPRARR